MGLGAFKLPDGLFYMNTGGATLDMLDGEIRDAIKKHDPALIVVDSWQFATGVDPKDVKGTIAYYNRFKGLGDGSILVIDHTRTPQAGDLGNFRPYGNQFKYAGTRSAIYLSKPNAGALVLFQPKGTFGPDENRLCVEINLDGIAGPVTLTLGDPDDLKFQPPPEDEGDADEKVIEVLGALGVADVAALARNTKLSESYVRTIITRQRKANRVKQNGRGSWTLVGE
jgi:hypothetical protein